MALLLDALEAAIGALDPTQFQGADWKHRALKIEGFKFYINAADTPLGNLFL